MIEQYEDLTGKVAKWINEEGYPLEYFAANTFSNNGFHATQGDFVQPGSGDAREIDVCATMWTTAGDGLVRLYNVIECKWSRKKPWVVFTSPTTRMAPSAMAAQALASYAGNAAMWANAGNLGLYKLGLFQSAELGGFGGRQALSSGQDKFYDSLRSVTAASIAIVEGYDRQVGFSFPQACVVAFPVIVIDGDLFEARYDSERDDLSLIKVDHSRCHWRGGSHGRFWTTIDIVTREGLPAFAKQRAVDFEVLLDALCVTYDQLRACYDQKDPNLLRILSGSTGTAGLPPLWHDIIRRSELG